MAWFKLTAPNGDPVQVNGDQLVCVRIRWPGFLPPGPRTQAIIEFTTGHSRQRWRRRIKFWIGSPERLRLSKRLGLWEPQRLWERRPRCDRRRDGRNDGRLGKPTIRAPHCANSASSSLSCSVLSTSCAATMVFGGKPFASRFAQGFWRRLAASNNWSPFRSAAPAWRGGDAGFARERRPLPRRVR